VVVAVKVTFPPRQVVVWLSEMLTDGVTEEVTVMVTELEVTVAGDAQLALLVISLVITSPLFKVVEA
jgi:hypothetical protein